MKSTEKSTQATILQWLSLKKYLHWRQNSLGFKTDNGHFYRTASLNGMPDIFCLKDSVLYGIEVKDIKGKQNPNQIEFQKVFEKAGGKYILAREVGDVMGMI